MLLRSLSLLPILALVALAGVTKTLTPHDPAAVKAAEFALNELSKISDSGIYQSLTLHSIVGAVEEDGVFHHNTILDVELASPYFKSGETAERFNIVVMDHKEDHVKSFAIDEFPVMDDEAIEAFWIAQTERKRQQREEAFRRLEIESLMLKNEVLRAKYEREDVETILQDVDRNEVYTRLRVDHYEALYKAKIADQHGGKSNSLASLYDEVELYLSKRSLVELYYISMGNTVSTTPSAVVNKDEQTDAKVRAALEKVQRMLQSVAASVSAGRGTSSSAPPLMNDFIIYKAQQMLDFTMTELLMLAPPSAQDM